MKELEVRNSRILKNLFCKDIGMPMITASEPYFLNNLNTLDLVYDCWGKYDTFCYEASQEASIEDYLIHRKMARIAIMKDLEIRTNSLRQIYCGAPTLNLPSMYCEENSGKTFLAISPKHGEFSFLKYLLPTEFKLFDSKEDYLRGYNLPSHLMTSKSLWDDVMKRVPSTRRVRQEKYKIIKSLVKHLEKHLGIEAIYSSGADDIIICLDTESCSVKRIIEASKQHYFGEYLSFEMFDISKIDLVDGWVKHSYNEGFGCACCDSVSFEKVDKTVLIQVIKKYYGLTISDDDLVFDCNGKLASYLKPIYILF